MKVLNTLRDGLTDEHIPLFLLLGAAASLERFVAQLPRPDAQPSAPADDDPAAVDQLLALVLGMVALHDSLTRIRASVAAPASRRSPRRARREPSLAELLR